MERYSVAVASDITILITSVISAVRLGSARLTASAPEAPIWIAASRAVSAKIPQHKLLGPAWNINNCV